MGGLNQAYLLIPHYNVLLDYVIVLKQSYVITYYDFLSISEEEITISTPVLKLLNENEMIVKQVYTNIYVHEKEVHSYRL